MATVRVARRLGNKMNIRSLPWLTDGANDFISEKILSGEIKDVLEFGSGASTYWLAQQGVNVISVEDDAAWYNLISEKLKEVDPLLGNKVDYRLIEEPKCKDLDKEAKITVDISVIGSELLDRGLEFDLVIVDGSMRLNCVLASYKLVRPHRYLILDNDERSSCSGGFPSYRKVHDVLSSWDKTSYEQVGLDRTGWAAPHKWITTVWKKQE